jgi:hypothetical protein
MESDEFNSLKKRMFENYLEPATTKNLNQKVINEKEASINQYRNSITSPITLIDEEAFSTQEKEAQFKAH